MNLAAYLRVSTEKQADDGLGLEVQREAVEAWAHAQGHKIASWHTDAASGALEDRLGLGDALAACRETRADGIVVYRLDRLARELVIQEQLIAQVAHWGRRVYSTIATEDALLDDATGDPSRVMVRQIIGAVAQFERAMIRLRTQAGKRKKRANGGWCGGIVPYGFRAVGGELEAYAPEQAQLAIIQAMRGAGATYQHIADTLAASGAPAPGGGTTWYKNSVRRLISPAGRH